MTDELTMIVLGVAYVTLKMLKNLFEITFKFAKASFET